MTATATVRRITHELEPDDLALRALRIATRTALGVLGDREAAADVAQEAALLAYRHAHTLRDPGRTDAWLHRSAVRASLQEARRRTRRSAAERASARPDYLDDADHAALDAAELLRELPSKQRAALTLRYVHDLDDAAIAAALGCRAGTVRSLLSRGLAGLRSTLDAEEMSR